MVVKVAVPQQFKLKVVPDLKTIFLEIREKCITSVGQRCFRHRWRGNGRRK